MHVTVYHVYSSMSFDKRSSAMEGNGSNPDIQQATATPAPAKCRAGCEFFASAMFDGLCSKCHKDKMLRQNSSMTSSSPQTTSSNPKSDDSSPVAIRPINTRTGSPTVPIIEPVKTAQISDGKSCKLFTNCKF